MRTLETKWITWSDTDVDAIFTHNDWLQLLTDYGLIGLILALVVLGTHSWNGLAFLLSDVRRSSRHGGPFFRDQRGAIALGALTGMIAFALHSAGDFQMHVGINAVLAAAMLGIMANPGAPPAVTADEEPAEDAPPARAWRVAAVAAAALPAAVMGWKFIPWAISDYEYRMALGTFMRATTSPEEYFVAAAAMQGAVEADPLNCEAWHYWGLSDAGAANFFSDPAVVEVRRQYLRKAVDRFKTAHRLYPQHPDISVSIARTLDQLNRFDEAEEWFLRALKWGSGSRMVNWYYADHLFATGRYQEAMERYIPVLHKYGGWKREWMEAQMRRCERILKKQREGTPAPPPSPAPGDR